MKRTRLTRSSKIRSVIKRIARRRRTAMFIASSVAAMFAGHTDFAQAQSPIFWDGSGADDNWNTLSNWGTLGANATTDPVAIPGATDDVVFYSAGGARLTTNLVNAPFTLRSLTFGNGQTGAVTIGGSSALTLDGLLNYNSSILGSGGVVGLTTPSTLRTGIYIQAGSGAITVGAPITLGNAQQWVNNSTNTLVVSGALTNGVNDLTIGGSGSTSISGAFTGSGTGGLTKFGAGTLNLTGVNTYTGATTVNFGTLNLGGGTGTGSLSASSALRMGGGTFTYSTTGTNTQTFAGLTVNLGASTINNTVSTNILNLGAITRATGNGTINFGTTTGQIRTTATNTNGIIGPWATFGTGTGLRYAVSNGGAAAITGFATGTAGTAGTLANVTSATTNYDYAAAATTAANLTGNTLRYTGAAATTAIGATNTLTLNGLMNAGTGALTVSGNATTGGLRTGSTGELAIATNTQGITISAVVGGSGAVTFSSGGGTLSLNAANTFTGVTTVNSGVLQMGNVAALGTVAGGTVVAPGAALNVNGLTVANLEPLTINGAGSGATPRGALTNGSGTTATWNGTITLGSNASIGSSSGTLTTGSSAATTLGSHTLTLNMGSTGNVTTFGIISGAGGVVVSGPGTGVWATSANHTYSGGTVLSPGSFTATNTSSTGTIGSPTSGPFGQGVLELAGGSLRSTTALATTIDNTVTISGDTTFNGVTGEKNLTLRGPVTLAGGNRTLTSTFGTVVAGTNVTLAGNIGEIGTSGLIKAGAGNLVLSGAANTYSGGTTVNAGLLNVTGGLAGTGNITVASTGYLSLISNSANAINTTGALNLGTAANGTAILGLDLGTSFDSLTGAAVATTAGNVYFNINPSAGFGAGTYTLLSSPAGGLAGATYGLGSLPSGFAYTLSPSATEVTLNVTAGAPAATNFYWGAGNSSWATNANWFSDVAGTTPASAAPTLGSSVFFNTTTATGPTIATTLDAPFTIDNLRFNANPTGITALTISSGNNVNNSLTISPISATDGITLGANNGVVTISAPITLGTPQTWTVDGTTGAATSSLVVSGLISGPANSAISFNPANSNPAQITLSSVGSTYSGASTIGANMNVVGGNVGAFSTNTNWTVNGTLSTGAFAQTTGSLVGGSGFVQNGSATAATLTIGNDNLGSPVSFAGTIQNGSTGALGITKVGTGVQVFSGANSYTGVTTINAGTLRSGSATTFGAAGIGNGALALAGTGAFDLNGFNAAFTNVSASVVGSSISNAGTSDTTLAISAQANTISSLVTDGATNKLAVTLRSNNSGATPFLLISANTFSGGLTLVDGTVLGAGTRLTINGAVTTVGAPGAITSSPFGTGAITIGQAATDRAGIFFSATSEVRNDIVFNTALGTDRAGIRTDVAGITLSGLITANLAPATFSSNTAVGTFLLTNQVTGASGLVLDTSQSTGATAFSVTLNNAAGTNNYMGDTVVGLGAVSGRNVTLNLGAADQIPNGLGRGNVVLNTVGTGVGLLNMAGFSETINGLNGSGTVNGNSGTPTLTVGDGNAMGSFSGIIQNTAGSLALTKIGSGTQTLSGTSTYSGLTTVNEGTLSFSASANLGNASATNDVTLSGGTLQYTGAGAVDLGANRQLTVISGTTNTIDTSAATGNLQITAGGIVTSGASASTNLIKSGPGTLTVTGAVDLQSGSVNVTGGTLIAGLHAANTGSISVGSSSSLQLVDSSAVNLTLLGTATGSLTLNSGRFGFELGATGVNDKITMTGANFATASGVNTLDFYSLSGFGVGTYDLLSAPGGLLGATYVLGNAPSGFNYVITPTDTLVSLQTTLLSNIYWTNSQSTGSWNTTNAGPLTNFSTDLAGATNYALVPQATDTVIFSSTAASVGASPINTTLDAAFTVDSLSFTNQPAAATISIAAGTGGTLTLAPVSTANGITVANNGGAVTISAPLTTGTAQTWSVDGTGTSSLALSGNVTLTGNVTKTGAGTLTVSGASNTGAGSFTLAAGTLNANSDGAIGTGTFTINNNATIDNTSAGTVTLTGSANTLNGNLTYTGSTQSLNLGTGAVTLGANALVTVGGNTLTIGGGLSDGASTFGLTKSGAGTLVLNGNITYDGPTILNAGTLTLNGANTFTGLVSVNAGTLNLNGTNSGTGGITIAAGASMNLNNDGALGSGRLTLNGGAINSPNAALTLSTNNVQTWGNGATVVSTGTNTLNLGTGQVTLGTDATTGTFALTNNAISGTPSLTVGGDISAVAGGTAGVKTVTIAGTGNTALTGNITRGAASGIVLTSTLPGTATLTLSGAASTIATLNLNAATGTSIVDVGTGNLTFANAGQNSLQSTTGGTINATGGGVLTLGAVGDNWGTANGTTLTINAKISGAAANSFEAFSVANGTGVMILANDTNDFAGNIAINSGVLRVSTINDVGIASGLGAGNGTGVISIGSAATSTGTLNYVGAGGNTNRVLNLSGTTSGGTIDLTGSTTSSSSPLRFTAAATATGAGSKTLTLTGPNSTFGEFAGAIVNNSGTNTTGVTKSGAGTWTLSGANTMSGAILISGTDGGTLEVTGSLANASSFTIGASQGAAVLRVNSATANSLGTNAINLDGAGNSSTARLELVNSSLANPIVMPARNSGTVAIQHLSGTSTLTGLISMGSGGSLHSIQSDSGLLNLANITTSATGTRTMTLGGVGNINVTGVMSNGTGTLGVAKIGSGVLTLSGANTYTGTTNISAGTLQVSGGSAIAGLVTLADVSGATLQVLGSETIAALSGGGTTGGNVSLDALQTLTLSAGGGNTYAGTIGGAGAIALSGGNQTLNGDLSHTGGVNVTGSGILTLGSSTNTYTGITAIGVGVGRSLLVTANGALGATGTGNETTLGSGGQLGFSGGINYSTTEKIIGSGVGNTGAQTPFAAGQRGFIQSVSGSNTFAGDIDINAGGISRIGTQEGASLNLTGVITQPTGNILFRSGSLTGDFVTLSNSGNSFGGNSTVFNVATGVTGNYAGVRLGVTNGLPTDRSISGLAGSGAGAALDLNGKSQTLNGLVAGDGGLLKIINQDTTTISTLTLNPTADQSTTNTTLLGGVGLGTINLVKDGAFTQQLRGANTSTGTIVVNQGTLQFGLAASLYNDSPASWTAANINVKSGATIAFNVGDTGQFTSSGLDTLLTNISVANSATEGLQAGAILGFDTTTVANAAGAFTQGSVIANSGGTNGGAIGVTKLGLGVLTLDKLNTYTGATNVSTVGSLVAGSTQAFGVNSATTVLGTLALAGNSNALGSLAGSGTVENASATAATLTVGGDNSSTVFSGLIQNGAGGGALSLVKTGTGTQTISGANTFSGTTVVNGGTLLVNSVGGLGTSSVTINGGFLGGTGGVVTGGVTLAGGSITPGSSIGTLGVGSVNGSGSLGIEYDSSNGSIDLLNVAGELNISSIALNFSDLNGAPVPLTQPFYVFANYTTRVGNFTSISGLPANYDVDYLFNSGTSIAIVAVPEPGTLALLTVAIVGGGLYRRSRKQKKNTAKA